MPATFGPEYKTLPELAEILGLPLTELRKRKKDDEESGFFIVPVHQDGKRKVYYLPQFRFWLASSRNRGLTVKH